jgi:lambda family phage portal protein
MNILRSLARKVGYVHREDVRRIVARSYAAAGQGRLLGDWVMSPTTADQDLRLGILGVRTRARDLAQNNDLAKAYLRAIKKNVVGSSGFSLQVKAMKQDTAGKWVVDKADSDYLENEFWKWSGPGTATVTGKISLRKAEELVAETVARDGELFVRLVRGAGINRYGFSLQFIEPDWIDEKYNIDLGGGRLIIMGVELDEWRRPVAYHVSRRRAELGVYGASVTTGPYDRIPASDILHLFDPERVDATRGISWMASGMVKSRHLDGYIEAAVVNSRASACKMGVIQEEASSEFTGDAKDSAGNTLTTLEPGELMRLLPGQTFQDYDPKYPEAQFDPFTKAMIRLIASGLGVSYQTLSGDLSETSYASGRQGLLEERETYKSAQSLFSEIFLTPVYSEWLRMGITSGALDLPMSKFDKFNSPKWTGRRWQWVDPLKDVQAAKEEVAAGFKSSTMIANENGRDLYEIYQELADEKALAEEYGLELNFGVKEAQGYGIEKGAADEGIQEGYAGSGNGKGRGQNGRPRLLV